MARPVKLLLVSISLVAAATALAACGSLSSEQISVPRIQPVLYHGATLFNQRCSGCHTLSYAATHGSAANVRTAQYNNGPNFDQRCERPITRVLYAIENGGFSGAIMPQNIVVGQDATDVAKFVATYSGRKAPRVPGVVPCQAQPIGTIPPLTAAGTAAATAQAKSASAAKSAAAGKVRTSRHKGAASGKKPSTGTGQGQGPG